ncbi:cupredoxin domain-containing protein [Paenibacillus sp. MWE-103]|uniref:Cupredoxin domain-containing protein n=1 Tax=Paenibacillus artemisiicola TaxID=1172618 RepID=A0ABS3W8N7_9BACL|nr:cupredoxin domain-containing protein [Paenibacillus artemisiicola]
MKKLLLMAVMLAAAIFILAACGSKSDSGSNAGNSGSVEETGTAAAAKITIKAKRYEFDQPEYTIKKGEPTELTLVSEDGVHGVEIPDLDVKLDSGKPKVVTINDAGTYEFHCDVPCGTGHAKMVAKIVVQ